MTPRPRPLRLRWRFMPPEFEAPHCLVLDGRHIEIAVGWIWQQTARPNTYEAQTSAGTILRGNNRRRLQARLRDAVIGELRAIVDAERKAGERAFERMLKRRNARIAKGRAA